MQSIDGYTSILYPLDKDDKKNVIISSLIQFLQDNEEEADREDIESALKSLRRLSFKKRISKFIEDYDKYGIFKEEKTLNTKYKEKKNVL